MHFGNCFCKPHNDVVWPNQHLNPFQIGLCLAKPSLCGYEQHFPKRFQRGVYTAAIWNRLCKWVFRGTVHFLLGTSSQVTVHACTGWVVESSSRYHSQTEIFSSWHRGNLDTHVIRKLVHMHEIDPLQCIQVFFDWIMQCTDQWVTMA